MTIACTRCGATCDGDFILPALAFTFKHDRGCGHGVGPLAVLPASYKSKQKEEFKKVEDKVETKIDEVKEIKVEEVVEKPKPKKSKKLSFGQKD